MKYFAVVFVEAWKRWKSGKIRSGTKNFACEKSCGKEKDYPQTLQKVGWKAEKRIDTIRDGKGEILFFMLYCKRLVRKLEGE